MQPNNINNINNTSQEDTMNATTYTLTAEILHNEWAVVDSTGGVWHPNDDARAEIDASRDPAAQAVRICRETPESGQWHQ